MGTDKVVLVGEQPEVVMTGSDRKYVLRMTGSAVFFLTRVVMQNVIQ
jgi:hypothetical protein